MPSDRTIRRVTVHHSADRPLTTYAELAQTDDPLAAEAGGVPRLPESHQAWPYGENTGFTDLAAIEAATERVRSRAELPTTDRVLAELDPSAMTDAQLRLAYGRADLAVRQFSEFSPHMQPLEDRRLALAAEIERRRQRSRRI